MTSLLDALGLAIAGRLAPTGLRIETPSLIAIVGPNGGGKTSLLRSLARADDSAGSVTIDGERLDDALPARRSRLVAFLPASHDAPWPIPVRDYLALGGNAEEAVAEQIARLELASIADRPMDRLSTGQRSRAMIGRVLASNARLLLLDEPLSNLDPYWALRVIDMLRTRAAHSAIIVTLHDLGKLPKFDRALVVDHGSIVVDDDPAATITSPAFQQAFGVVMEDGQPALRRPADPQSSR